MSASRSISSQLLARSRQLLEQGQCLWHPVGPDQCQGKQAPGTVVRKRVALGGLHGSPAPQDRFVPAPLHETDGDLLTQGPGQGRLGSVPGLPCLSEALLRAHQAAGEQVKGTEQGTAPGAR